MNWSDDYHANWNKNCHGTSNCASNSSWKKKENWNGIFFYFYFFFTYPTKVITVWLENQWNCAKLCAYREFDQKVNHMMAVQLEKNGNFFIFCLNFFREITIWIYGIFIGWWGAPGHTLVCGNSAGDIVIGRRGWHLTSSWKKN